MAKPKTPRTVPAYSSAGFTWRSRFYPAGTEVQGIPPAELNALIAAGHVVSRVQTDPAPQGALTQE